VFKSANAGRTWQSASTGLGKCEVRALVLDPIAPQTLYAGTACGVFKSVDGARGWSSFNEGLGDEPTGLDVTELAISIDGRRLYAVTKAGLAATRLPPIVS
jgi:hypothetical protein